MTPTERIKAALRVAEVHGHAEGAHHLAWVIDQMVRDLTDCPMVEREAIDCRGERYTYAGLGESEAYLQFVDRCAYEWDEGIAP